MASLREQIIEYLATHKRATGKDIALAIKFSKSSVNHELYLDMEPEGLVRQIGYAWELTEKALKGRANKYTNSNLGEIIIDADSRRVLQYIEAKRNVFVTGKAGTGKTTLLRKIRDDYKGKRVMITLAPTGVAAENAGGYTLHSFLRVPLTPFIPKGKMSNLYSLEDNVAEVVRNLDMIIIDEISMVRCDMLDAADSILRHYRGINKPFGGVQLVMFGDLYQLMPVVKQEDWTKIGEYYSTPYFFSSAALIEMEYYICELSRVWRQKDDRFIEMLNHIRVGQITLNDLGLLNTRYDPIAATTSSSDTVTLMTRNRKTKIYNQERLDLLPGQEKLYKAKYSDNWFGKNPAEKVLALKVGARVMFVKNDTTYHNYVNGTMGWVVAVNSDSVSVKLDKNNEIINVGPAKWDLYDFYIDKKTKIIFTTVIGYFSQIPLKLAWAVTVHKSQGLTFDKVNIDAADSFTYGQIYVALSRCRTLTGIKLLEKIPSHKIMADQKIEAYIAAKEIDGKVKRLPEFKQLITSKDLDSSRVLCFWVRASKYQRLRGGELKSVKRSVTEEYEAKSVFQSNEKGLVIHPLFSHLSKTWKHTDMNDGNCPFLPKVGPVIQICCEQYNDSLFAILSECVQIQANTEKNKWQVTARFNKVYTVEEFKLLVNRQ